MSGVHIEIGRPQQAVKRWSSKSIYFSLLEASHTATIRAESAVFLTQQLSETHSHATTMPATFEQLDTWLAEHNENVGRQYHAYLAARKAGQPRQYFRTKSHALFFLRAVAPTKLVDGSWLYGLMKHWQDPRLASLIKIYLEELGDGVEAMNHVVLYRKLLKLNACEDWKNLDENFFTQGAIQLALAAHTDSHLPEVIGFNLGYEQLPLHLLITAYELKELNIDPYYFTLHTTIDNAQSGHARSAIDAVREAMPLFGDSHDYIRRVIAGVKLNDVGLSTLDIIRQFDLHAEVVRILQSKANIGQFMHSDRCVIAGKTVNEWLADQDQVAVFLAEMENVGWVKRHQNPEDSPFWKVIAGDKAPMFGVFTGYEQQVIYDWIAGEAIESLPMLARLGRPWRMVEKQSIAQEEARHKQYSNVYDFHSGNKLTHQLRLENDFNQDQLSFERHVHSIDNEQKLMQFLVDWMSPAKHYTSLGLCATRYFKSHMDSLF
ncbi:MAG: iron-containing redox enzyme family protein [Methylophilus sp.]|uniref:iron-containing redox enzyme family protein n=1 Tax=Methylophilus sp. TaxID=29541 RepID=UPI003F9FCDB9